MATEQGDSLFAEQKAGEEEPESQPLPLRLAPRNLSEFVGQEEAIGKNTPLRRALEADRLSSLILHGPPGVGKTALANIVARRTEAAFERLNAVLAGKDDLRAVIKRARQRQTAQSKRTILFFDEIHRFNKAQQDALLPSVEKRILILIGATTQNPYYYLNNALISRSLLVEFQELSKDNLRCLLNRALEGERGYNGTVELTAEAEEYILDVAGGDARRLLQGLEIAVLTAEQETISRDHLEGVYQQKYVDYDRAADHHYDVASAFIKSIRGSDPDAAIYYLARMLEAGEDPRFIGRRLIIAAAEDIGNAAPYALTLAVSAMQAVETVGLPEAQIPLAQATTYLAASPKSNASYEAIKQARQKIQNGLDLPVPPHLRDSSYGSEKDKQASGDYLYPHNYPEGYVEQDYLTETQQFYNPTTHGQEARLKKFLDELDE